MQAQLSDRMIPTEQSCRMGGGLFTALRQAENWLDVVTVGIYKAEMHPPFLFTLAGSTFETCSSYEADWKAV